MQVIKYMCCNEKAPIGTELVQPMAFRLGCHASSPLDSVQVCLEMAV